VGGFGGETDVVVGCVGVCHGDVGADRVVEEVDVLEHDGDVAVQFDGSM
jgi:hypothetical protein